VALVLTFTRSTWLAMPIAATVMLARRRPRALWLVPLLTGLALLVLPPAYRSRLRTSFDPTHHSNADRLEMWQTGLAMWKARPWTGVGIGDLQPVYAEYAPHEVQRIYGHLHNNWVHVLATMGAIGVLAFGWLMLQCGRIVHRAGTALADPELRALALGGWGGFWGFQIMGLFEWNFGDVEVTIAFYFLLGLFAAASRGRQG
jgi:O-antigen ligase